MTVEELKARIEKCEQHMSSANELFKTASSEEERENISRAHYYWRNLRDDAEAGLRKLAIMGSGVSNNSNGNDGTKGVDINGGYTWINGQKIYDNNAPGSVPRRAGYQRVKLDLSDYEMTGLAEAVGIKDWKREYVGGIDINGTPFLKCDCGAAKTYGDNCGPEMHASYCSLQGGK